MPSDLEKLLYQQKEFEELKTPEDETEKDFSSPERNPATTWSGDRVTEVLPKLPKTVEFSKDKGIRFEDIAKEESITDHPYIPRTRKGKVVGASGVTIGPGIDLGQRDMNELDRYVRKGLVRSETLKKIKPFVGKRRKSADSVLKKYREDNKITDKNTPMLSFDEIDEISNAVVQSHYNPLKSNYDRLKPKIPFDQLPNDALTALFSLAWHKGPSFMRNKKMFKEAIKEGNFDKMAESLDKEFSKKYGSRRTREGTLFKRAEEVYRDKEKEGLESKLNMYKEPSRYERIPNPINEEDMYKHGGIKKYANGGLSPEEEDELKRQEEERAAKQYVIEKKREAEEKPTIQPKEEKSLGISGLDSRDIAALKTKIEEEEARRKQSESEPGNVLAKLEESKPSEFEKYLPKEEEGGRTPSSISSSGESSPDAMPKLNRTPEEMIKDMSKVDYSKYQSTGTPSKMEPSTPAEEIKSSKPVKPSRSPGAEKPDEEKDYYNDLLKQYRDLTSEDKSVTPSGDKTWYGRRIDKKKGRAAYEDKLESAKSKEKWLNVINQLTKVADMQSRANAGKAGIRLDPLKTGFKVPEYAKEIREERASKLKELLSAIGTYEKSKGKNITPYQREYLNYLKGGEERRIESQEERLTKEERSKQFKIGDSVVKVIKMYKSDPLIKKLEEQNLSFSEVEGLIDQMENDNQMAVSPIGVKMAKAMGEVGVLTDRDVTRYIEPRGLSRQVANTLSLWKDGKIDKASTEDLKHIVAFFRETSRNRNNEINKKYQDIAYKNYAEPLGLSREESDERFVFGDSPKKDQKGEYTPGQERGIEKVMKGNNLSREEAIKALKESGRM